ncbi:hypothetical protein C1A40_02865 [Tamlana carrageenivorans]|uniref:Uncharacterized protein n=1 Tax=Pseudotamlana carrageenivorans TaxID=2069432 RepID=A0A2I7SMY9_9FLAO|nr:hypothetical protein C1A40_02865 [Tamlana carrageenivorans]
MLSWLYSVLFPLQTLHESWKQFRVDNLYKLAHTGQVCYLRAALNDAFDVSARRIYIDGTGGNAQKTYVYTVGENQPKYLKTLYLHNALEFANTGADFIVYVPSSIAQSQGYELRALIDFYKVASKRYLIIEI